ncbi:hypothetical protein EMIT051CA3_20445 [Pseudomonas chlororaphis]
MAWRERLGSTINRCKVGHEKGFFIFAVFCLDSDISVFALLLENGGELLYARDRTEAAEFGMLCRRTSSMIACFGTYPSARAFGWLKR